MRAESESKRPTLGTWMILVMFPTGMCTLRTRETFFVVTRELSLSLPGHELYVLELVPPRSSSPDAPIFTAIIRSVFIIERVAQRQIVTVAQDPISLIIL